MYLHPFRRVVFAGVTFLVRYQWGVIGDIVNTKTISTGLVALLMIIMALAPGAMNVTELNDEIDTEYGHESVIDGTANMAGILSWQDDAWDASWTCEGGLALVKAMNWYDFVNSGEDDPHNYTSWGMNLTGAGSYETNNAPEGTWVVTAGLTCTDNEGVLREAGGQFGDDPMNSTVNLTNGTTIGDVSFMLIEHGEDMEDEQMFVCGNGDQIAFGKVNNGLQDCEDGADEQQYDAANEPMNWFDCYSGDQVWIHQVNDGTEDCPDGDDEMPDDDEEGLECVESFIEFHLETSSLGGVNFVFDMVCEISEEQSNEYREYADMFGNGDGVVTIDEVEDFMLMMNSCTDEDGMIIECDDSCYEEDGTETDCNNDDEEWSINGVVMEMYDTGMSFDMDSVMGTGSITMMTGQSSKHVDLVDGENTVTVKFENLDDYDDGSECFEVQVLPSAFWKPVSVDVSPAEDWEVSIDEQNSQGFNFYGCSTPDTFTAVFTFMGDEHPNGVENLPPICEFNWFMANDTAFEEGHILTEGPDGDVEIELDAGSYMISVWCKDAEMDFIQVKWEAPALNLSNTFEGDGEVNGWVMFMVPPGLSEEIVVPYSWTSEEWTGTGEFIITLDSGEGDGGDVEGDGGGLPGFTSLLTITALLGAVFFLGRRESE